MKESFCSVLWVIFTDSEWLSDAQLLQQQHLTALVVCVYHYYIPGHSFQVTQCLFKLCQCVWWCCRASGAQINQTPSSLKSGSSDEQSGLCWWIIMKALPFFLWIADIHPLAMIQEKTDVSRGQLTLSGTSFFVTSSLWRSSCSSTAGAQLIMSYEEMLQSCMTTSRFKWSADARFDAQVASVSVIMLFNNKQLSI